MQHRMVLPALLSLGLGACAGDQPAATGPDADPKALTVIFSPQMQDGACNPQTTYWAHDNLALYRVEHRQRHESGDHRPTTLPGQAIFYATDDSDWRQEQVSTGLNFAEPCNQVTIRLGRFECRYDSGDEQPCPPVQIRGAEHFAAILLE